jgi:hypothetical protein
VRPRAFLRDGGAIFVKKSWYASDMAIIKIYTPSGLMVYEDVNNVEVKSGALVFYTRETPTEPYTRMTTNLPFIIEGVH